jgi:hypothetical protein
MLIKLSQYWASLPHAVRTAIVLFGGAAGGVLKHSLSQPNACFTGPCLHGYIVSAASAGMTAVVALYIPSPLGRKPWPGEVPTQAK